MQSLEAKIAELPSDSQERWRKLMDNQRDCSWLAHSVVQCPECGHGVALVRWQGYTLRCQRRIRKPERKEVSFAPCGWSLHLSVLN